MLLAEKAIYLQTHKHIAAFVRSQTKSEWNGEIAHVVHVSYCDLWHFVCHNLFETLAFPNPLWFSSLEQQSASCDFSFFFAFCLPFFLTCIALGSLHPATNQQQQQHYNHFITDAFSIIFVVAIKLIKRYESFLPFKTRFNYLGQLYFFVCVTHTHTHTCNGYV